MRNIRRPSPSKRWIAASYAATTIEPSSSTSGEPRTPPPIRSRTSARPAPTITRSPGCAPTATLPSGVIDGVSDTSPSRTPQRMSPLGSTAETPDWLPTYRVPSWVTAGAKTRPVPTRVAHTREGAWSGARISERPVRPGPPPPVLQGWRPETPKGISTKRPTRTGRARAVAIGAAPVDWTYSIDWASSIATSTIRAEKSTGRRRRVMARPRVAWR